MNVLIVYAHPEPRSFNGAMRDLALDTLQTDGHNVVVSDLYAMRFKAVADADDFRRDRNDASFLNIAEEQMKAMKTQSLALDIREEQEKIRRADLLILQFPIWWFGMPAILKGWADRVFARGFAYKAGRKYDTGLFRGKDAMVATTTGTSADTYAPDGIDGDILNVLWPIHNGLLHYTGFSVLPPFVAYMAGRVGQQAREGYLRDYQNRLHTLATTRKLFFHPAEDYGANERLRPGVVAKSGVQRNIV